MAYMNMGLIILAVIYVACLWHMYPKTTRKVVMTPLRAIGYCLLVVFGILGLICLFSIGPTGIIIFLLWLILMSMPKNVQSV